MGRNVTNRGRGVGRGLAGSVPGSFACNPGNHTGRRFCRGALEGMAEVYDLKGEKFCPLAGMATPISGGHEWHADCISRWHGFVVWFTRVPNYLQEFNA